MGPGREVGHLVEAEMLLAVDIGNIHIGLGVHDGKRWRARFRVRTVREKTPDEYHCLLESLLRRHGISVGELRRAVVASVVPPLTAVFRELCEDLLGTEYLVVGPGVRTGLNIRVDHPSEVGPDLVADAVAAYERFKASCVVVDFGTATAFVAVKEPGVLLGVALAPGLEVAADALAQRAAQLPRAPLSPPRRAIGKNTLEALQAGLVLGYVGLVEGLIRRVEAELGESVHTVATGFYASPIVSLTSVIEAYDPWLTLEGLLSIARRNP